MTIRSVYHIFTTEYAALQKHNTMHVKSNTSKRFNTYNLVQNSYTKVDLLKE